MSDHDQAIIKRQDDNGYTVLTLNRPDRRNALSRELIVAFRRHLDDIANDSSLKAVVVTGQGKSFCAGGDLAGGMMTDGGVVGAHEDRAGFGLLLQDMRGHPAIFVAAVNGDALGGGLGLAVGCDLVVAEPSARFGTPEIKLGLFPWVILALLNRHVGQKRLMELVMLGQKVSAEEALHMGLINRLSADGEVMTEAVALAEALAKKAPIPLRMGKAAFYSVSDSTFEDAIRFLNTQLSLNLMTEDAMEGVAAFMQRRDPQWKGR